MPSEIDDFIGYFCDPHHAEQFGEADSDDGTGVESYVQLVDKRGDSEGLPLKASLHPSSQLEPEADAFNRTGVVIEKSSVLQRVTIYFDPELERDKWPQVVINKALLIDKVTWPIYQIVERDAYSVTVECERKIEHTPAKSHGKGRR